MVLFDVAAGGTNYVRVDVPIVPERHLDAHG